MLLDDFIEFFRSRNYPQEHHYLLAVSGGVDSAVLAYLARRAGLRFSIAHCNFQLREEESLRDEIFVREMAASYGVEFHLNRFDTKSFASGSLSIQEAARNLRYEWFEALRRQTGSAYILLAHHADDNIETLLMNFLRGTGLRGMTGIPQREPDHILRPLLKNRKKEILEFAEQNNLKWVEDSSNEKEDYTRNRIRNMLMPAIREIYPSIENNLLDNIDRFKRIRRLYEEYIEKLKDSIVIREGNEIRIPALKLLQYGGTPLLFEIIRDFGFGEKQAFEAERLLTAETGKYIANDQYCILKHRRWLVITPRRQQQGLVMIHEGEKLVEFADGRLKLRELPAAGLSIPGDENIATLDQSLLEYPLILRKWRQGDYFYPLGMPKKKKLSRFFIDRKLSRTEKEDAWVLESGKRIVWVAGMRIDHRFRITGNTQSALEITWEHE